MTERFLDAYDEASSLLMEAVWEKYASREQIGAIILGLNALDVLRADADELPSTTPR
jgi:hypothetical protein